MKIERRRILIVDDCDEDRQNAKRLLTQVPDFQWEFVEAADGTGGLALARSASPLDCILLDYHLKDMDGMEFLQQLPKLLGEPGLPAVLLTGAGNGALAVRAMKKGLPGYLSKNDLDATLLSRAIEYAIINFHLALASRQSVQAMEVAHRELEAFTYSVSHDLRAPLRHIAGFSGILLNDFGPGMAVEAQNMLRLISATVGRMELMVDGLLRLSKLEQQPLKIRAAELNLIVDQVISVLQPEVNRPVEWRIAHLPAVQCDPTLIAQVFQNLISNALKYSRDRACAAIEIGSIEAAGKPSVIFVRDNGAGFDMNYAQRLFGAFQRMHTESEFEGTGIGLAIAQRIIRRHRGTIWAEAEPDRGACFYFTLTGEDAPKL